MKQNDELLCKSANGKQIVYDPINSHAATHFQDNPMLKKLVIEVLSKKHLEGDLIAEDIDMGRPIGNTDVVEVDKTDKIIYAKRVMREDQGYVPFTKSRTTQPSSFISVYLVYKVDDIYELSSAWIGEFESPVFPQMETATSESIPYWTNHAFVWGSQGIIPGSERTDCPW